VESILCPSYIHHFRQLWSQNSVCLWQMSLEKMCFTLITLPIMSNIIRLVSWVFQEHSASSNKVRIILGELVFVRAPLLFCSFKWLLAPSEMQAVTF
jgi:hypothetical protein